MTLEFLSQLKAVRQETMESWARGNLTRESVDGTVQVNAEAIGGVSTLTQTIEIIEEWKSLETGMENIEGVTT